jgi:transcriptional regulator with XRE-family HTH domain
MNAVQCRMARAALQLGVRELAMLAQVSTGTISKLERGEALLPRTGQAIRRALEAKGIEFFDHPPGARFREPPNRSVGGRSLPVEGSRVMPRFLSPANGDPEHGGLEASIAQGRCSNV